MTSEDIREFQRAQPFRPFRLTLTNGEEFDVKHPELILAGDGMVYVLREAARNTDPRRGGSAVHASLAHVLKIEYLTPAAAPPVDRSTV